MHYVAMRQPTSVLHAWQYKSTSTVAEVMVSGLPLYRMAVAPCKENVGGGCNNPCMTGSQATTCRK